MNLISFLLWSFIPYGIAYFVVTLIGMLHTIFNISILGYAPMNEHGMGEAYEKTKPFHPLYNLVCFPIAAGIFYGILPPNSIWDTVWLGIFWFVFTALIDLIGWVWIPHPWHLSPKAFYLDYQPWISLTYFVILIAPILTGCFLRWVLLQ